MANFVNYNLQGPGITVGYGDGKLTLGTDDQGLTALKVASEENPHSVTTTTTENGIAINTVLLVSDRRGVGYTLSLLLPEVDLGPQETNADVTGVAIITLQYRNIVGGPPAVLQQYEVKALSGTAALAGGTASA